MVSRVIFVYESLGGFNMLSDSLESRKKWKHWITYTIMAKHGNTLDEGNHETASIYEAGIKESHRRPYWK